MIQVYYNLLEIYFVENILFKNGGGEGSRKPSRKITKNHEKKLT